MSSITTTSWPPQDIVYVSIVAVFLLAALLEWVLWLAAFLYCLVKVFQKAENVSTKACALVIMTVFTILRMMFLPVIMVTIPLPLQLTSTFSKPAVKFFQWFAFWMFSSLLTIPWLLCVYQLVTHSTGRSKKIKVLLDESTAPKMVIVIPCYKELPDILLRTIHSIVECDYPSTCLHIFLSFDGEREDNLYLNTIERLGVPLVRRAGFPTSIDVTYRNARITVSRFSHGGKRHCQKRTFKLIERVYKEFLKVNDNLFVLFIDSDCILDKACIQNFMYEMELKPGSKHSMLAMTGVITATTERNKLITLLQDMEYVYGQLFERAVESGCGAVSCLPGALTVLRFSTFRRLAEYYFADKAEQCDDLFDYGKCHLGEDRWLTHLFMVSATRSYQIAMSTSSFCKTEAVRSFRSLLKQRRRWFLGYITNEVCMLTDLRLWVKYPFLSLLRLAQNTIKTTTLFFFIVIISLITTSEKVDQLPVGFIVMSLCLNWALMAYFAIFLGRYKIMLYPLLFVLGPFLNWIFLVYGVFTAGQRTWGGPRADAARADELGTSQVSLKDATAAGDDLNVNPGTFRRHASAATLYSSPEPPRISLTSSLEGRHDKRSPHARTSERFGLTKSYTIPARNKAFSKSANVTMTKLSASIQAKLPHTWEKDGRPDDSVDYRLLQRRSTPFQSSHSRPQDFESTHACGDFKYNTSSEWTDTDGESDLGLQNGLYRYRDDVEKAATLPLIDFSPAHHGSHLLARSVTYPATREDHIQSRNRFDSENEERDRPLFPVERVSSSKIPSSPLLPISAWPGSKSEACVDDEHLQGRQLSESFHYGSHVSLGIATYESSTRSDRAKVGETVLQKWPEAGHSHGRKE